ncbi:hypothetical protein L6164_019247 [Bauhinia variegata]|uniref:Uncharacterized protein n=1 Tax=Bauhinia variegata TaxID=167791 RepID=A0ACB9NDL3_BAUVA|nr:hypothetical protein L6164_019247 [Bauhinia variegata]
MRGKLNDRLKPDKSALSYADLHEITKSVEDGTLNSYGNNNRADEDELVKCMSNLPGYLERGENIHEKVLNVGVLDWTRLEQWQYSHKRTSQRNSRSSSSTSNTSSSISADGLSGHSSRGDSWSPSRQRLCRPSLQSHFITSPVQGHSKTVKSSVESTANFQNPRACDSNVNAQSKFVTADEHLPDSKLKACNRRSLDPDIDKGTVILPNDQRYDATSYAKLEKRSQVIELGKKGEAFPEPNVGTVEQGLLRKSKPVVFLLSRDIASGSDMRTFSGQKSGNQIQTIFSEKYKELSVKDLNYGISRACPLPCEVNCNHFQAKGSCSIDVEIIKSPTAIFSAPQLAKMGISPSRCGKSEEKKQTVATVSSSNGTFQGLRQRVTSEKSRSSSPFRRLSISLGYTGKGSGCKEGVYMPSRSSVPATKSSSENVRHSVSSDISGNDKPGDASKSRSSPLRRLLDPLLKPKAASCRHSMESPRKDTVLINKNSKSAKANLSVNKLDTDQRVGCSMINNDDLSKEKKHVSSTAQALLRITVKNGLPLFTFAVNNNSNILAATVKLSASRKDDYGCIYTFFTFREIKKKNASWMNHAGKGKGPDYIRHVVAQMKVSDSHFYDLTGQNCVDSSTVREFVLFSVKLSQGDDQASNYQPIDELAAIVVKIPKAVSFINDVHQGNCRNENQDLVHATVLLPSGVHSLPSNGGPSSLIERWKSGGSCDCGGWDLGCKLKVLANDNQGDKKSKSSKAHFADQFQLSLQGNGQGHQPSLSLALCKHGLYSVAFDSLLSPLQAFSICIALVESKIQYELSESKRLVEGKIPRESLFVQTDGTTKALSKLEYVPGSYVSCPPHSPVGRV